MIFVSQGHQQSIGLEIFFKSFSLLNSRDRKLFHLVGDKFSIEETLNSIPSNLDISGLNYHYLEASDMSQSHQSLQYCLDKITAQNILITLPTSKDQLPGKGGHSQFFRHIYKKEHIAMVFESLDERILLITDHIPLKDVSDTIDAPLIVSKVTTTLKGYASLKTLIKEVIFSGINPHAGEEGLLGSEDATINHAIKELKAQFPHISFLGPFSADALHFFKRPNQLFVYMYHDQALPKFKSEHGTIGTHLTFGLPFLRMSVDHGTAFNLYKKNQANYMGMYNLLNRAIACL